MNVKTPLTLDTPLAPASGGTGLSSITNHGVMLGAGTGNVTTVVGGSTNDVLTWNGTTWISQAPSGGGAVSSVFTRTGAVTAATGDYTAAQVTNAADTTAANTFANVSQTITKNALAATTASALSLENTTASTSGTLVQISPSLNLKGRHWVSSADTTFEFRIIAVPASGSPSGKILFQGNNAGAGWADAGSLTNGGYFTVGDRVDATNGFTVGGAAATAGRYLRGNGTAFVMNTIQAADMPVFVASGASHAPGAVPDPGSSAGSTKYLREDGTWATPSGGGGSSPLTTKGDLFTYSTADARLAVGTNDQTLVADSSATNGIAWRDHMNAFFGDGSDGAITFDGTTTLLGIVPSSSTYQLTRDIFLADGSTINSGVIIDTHGWRILCQGTLTNNGTIQSNGSVSSSGGNGANTNSVGGGTKGANGRSTAGAGANGTNSAGYAFGGVGGTGGGNTGTAGVGGTITTGNPNSPRDLASFLSGVAIFPLEAGSTVYALMGGTGGGAGAYASGTKSGAGGGGGGTVHIRARHIINTSGTIQALGGAGTAATGTGNADGGGGGGGGKVELLYQTRTGNTPLVTGGVGGAGIGTGATGATGSSGNIYYNQV
jgi:hypothetical protein